MSIPTSRNAPCHCGSGKRYKDCHGAFAGRPREESPDKRVRGVHVVPPIGHAANVKAPAGNRLDAPQRAKVLREQARAEWMRGEAGAASTCRAAIEYAPEDVAAWNLLGQILRGTDATASEGAWRHALVLEPSNAEASFHLGNLSRERGNAEAAILYYEHALAVAAGHPGVLNNLGLALEAIGARDRAAACYRQVLAADPQQTDAVGNLANSLFEREEFGQAATMYDALFSIRRDVPASVWARGGMTYQRLGNLDAAEGCFREAARRMPDDIRIQLNLGTVCSELKRYADGDAAWLRALELDPRNPYALSMLAHGRQHRCAWEGLDSLFAEINQLLESEPGVADHPISPFATLSMPTSLLAQLRAAQRWRAQFAPTPAIPRPNATIVAGERLRVGFVSSDFRDHPMAHLSMEFWERLDRDRIETFAYGIQAADPGAIGKRIVNAFEHFADVSGTSDMQVAQRIAADRIAILLDLNGYTTNSRARIFAFRPAPIQVNCLGFPGTLGADWYDYAYVDRFSAPEAMQPYFTERFLYMPNASFPSDTTRAPKGAGLARAECGLPESVFVFCCFNNAYKILPSAFAIWMRLLAAIEGAVLWLLDANADAKQNLRREAARAGVNPDRLIFAPKVPVHRHVARNACADLFLDSFPYGAHTTANDALLAGLPVIACAGDTLASRIAGSQLHAIGLAELVTSRPKDYEEVVIRLARHPQQLHQFRTRLGVNRHTYPLFDMTRYARDFEEMVTRVWQDHVAPGAAESVHGPR